MSFADSFIGGSPQQERKVGRLAEKEYALTKLLCSTETAIQVISMHLTEIRKQLREHGSTKQIRAKWKELNAEEKDVRRYVLMLQDLKLRVVPEDQAELERKISPVFAKYRKVTQRLSETSSLVHTYVAEHSAIAQDSSNSNHNNIRESSSSGINIQGYGMLQKLEVPEGEAEQIDEDWESLETNMLELNDMFQDLMHQVVDQRELIESIEDHISRASEDVHTGTGNIIQASRYKSARFTIGGALLGGAILGPIGFIGGLKAGAGLSALAGAIGGGFTGSWLKKRAESRTNMDENLHRDNADKALLSGDESVMREVVYVDDDLDF